MTMVRRIIFAGAAAGAFALAGCETVQEDIAEEFADTYEATLTGAQEVGGGDPDGWGKAEISITDEFDRVCWDVNSVRNIGPVTAAHVHIGARGVNGPPVFTLRRNDEGEFKGCADGAEWTEDRIEGNPQMFYVNLHTAQYPNGAIRGQLSR